MEEIEQSRLDRSNMFYWPEYGFCDCKSGEASSIEEKVKAAFAVYDPEFSDNPDEKWIVVLGIAERCSKCKEEIHGYGDISMFATEEEAREFAKSVIDEPWSVPWSVSIDRSAAKGETPE